MKIAIDSRSATLHAGTGIGTYTKNLVLNLIKDKKYDYDIIWTGENDCLKDISPTSKTYITSGRYSTFFENIYIPQILSKDNISLYHIPQNGIGFPYNSLTNTVVTIHDLIPYIMPETVGKGYLEKFLKEMPKIISKAKGIFTVSNYSKKDILRFFPNFPEDKIIVTPLAANDNYKPLSKDYCKNYIKDNFNIENDFVLYLGGFSSRKNVKNLILSYEKIRKDLKNNCKLVLIGSIKDEGLILKDLVSTKGLSDDVIFTGYVEDSILPLFYNACEAFVYPSLYEGFGLPPLEAMKCKCAVITSNVTSIPEVTGDSCLLIDPKDTDSISSSIIKTVNNNLVKEELGEKAYIKSHDFSWAKTAKETIRGYEYILGEREKVEIKN